MRRNGNTAIFGTPTWPLWSPQPTDQANHHAPPKRHTPQSALTTLTTPTTLTVMINLGLSRTSSCKVYNEIAQNDNSQKLQKNWAIMQYMIFVSIFEVAKNDNLEKWIAARNDNLQGVGSDCISRANSAIRGKLVTALQAYTLNPSTKFPPNPTSRKINTQELTSWHCLNCSMYAFIYCIKNIKNKEIEPYNNIYLGMHATFSSSAVMLTLKCWLF